MRLAVQRWLTLAGLLARLVRYGVCCVRGWRRLCWWWASAGECLRPVRRDRERERVTVSVSVSVLSFSVRVCVCVFGSAWMRTMCLAVE
eukprot:COSAG06_NODE_36482_length_446_cov_13.904899_1_plen_88_part_01